MMEILTDELTERTINAYCCATCYGHLEKIPVEGRKWGVRCAAYGDDHAGFVTKYYADRRRSESKVEILEVRDMLQNIGAIEKSGRTVDQVLSELGF